MPIKSDHVRGEALIAGNVAAKSSAPGPPTDNRIPANNSLERDIVEGLLLFAMQCTPPGAYYP